MGASKLNTDRIAAIFIGAVVVVFWWQLRSVSVALDVIFPRFILASMLLLAVVLFAKSILWPEAKSVRLLWDKRILTGAGASVLWVVLFPIVGFGVTSTFILCGFSWFLEERLHRTALKAVSSVFVSIAIVFIIHLIFSSFLEVPLPTGILF